MKQMSRGLPLLLVLPIACTRGYDLNVVNPCPQSLSVAFYSVPAGDVETAPVTKKASLTAESVTRVERAFVDANGFDWTVVVEGDVELPVDGKALELDTLVLPARVCPGS